MAKPVEDILFNLANILHSVVSTHSFFHLNNSKEQLLEKLDEIIKDLTTPVDTPADLTKDTTQNV